MTWILRHAAKAVDLAAAGLFAAAVVFAASVLGGDLLATVLGPLAFLLVHAALAKVDGDPIYRLGDFGVESIAAPEPVVDAAHDDGKVVRLFEPRQLAVACPSGGGGGARVDARQALSDAFAELSRSLR
jgi:hypothetical protein